MSEQNLTVVVGLGKTGLSCVRHLVGQGVPVAVTDNRPEPPCLEKMRELFPDVPLSLGRYDESLLRQAKELVVSPGVSVQEPIIAQQMARGTWVIGDIELFARVAKAPVVAITGSNGKSTVTTLVGEMARAAGWDVKIGGNLGIPVLDLWERPEPDLYVLELSSFQLETTFGLHPKAAVILNLSADHMDRYRSVGDYLRAKQRIYQDCEFPVVNRDEPTCWEGLTLSPNRVSFGLNGAGDTLGPDQFGLRDGYLYHGDQQLCSEEELQIKGHHQVANALAALALGQSAGIPLPDMLRALRSFKPLSHRCEWAARYNGVDWYNDSKGTNVGATLAAIEGIGAATKGDLVLIAGGLGKGADFSPLVDAIQRHVKSVILIGHDASLMEEAFRSVTKIIHAPSMAKAVHFAYAEATSGDAVLLSPACASFDMFPNFEVRGEAFMAAVRSLG